MQIYLDVHLFWHCFNNGNLASLGNWSIKYSKINNSYNLLDTYYVPSPGLTAFNIFSYLFLKTILQGRYFRFPLQMKNQS